MKEEQGTERKNVEERLKESKRDEDRGRKRK